MSKIEGNLLKLNEDQSFFVYKSLDFLLRVINKEEGLLVNAFPEVVPRFRVHSERDDGLEGGFGLIVWGVIGEVENEESC